MQDRVALNFHLPTAVLLFVTSRSFFGDSDGRIHFFTLDIFNAFVDRLLRLDWSRWPFCFPAWMHVIIRIHSCFNGAINTWILFITHGSARFYQTFGLEFPWWCIVCFHHIIFSSPRFFILLHKTFLDIFHFLNSVWECHSGIFVRPRSGVGLRVCHCDVIKLRQSAIFWSDDLTFDRLF